MKDIAQKRGRVKSLFYAWRGWPLYDTAKYISFLGDLFGTACPSKPYWQISDLDSQIGLYIHAADLRLRKPVIYRMGDAQLNNRAIADVLAESSAIPFVFNTYAHLHAIVDGGLLDNFPSDTILDVIAASRNPRQEGYVVGVSFEADSKQWQFTGAIDYISALIATAIDSPVQRSIKKLNAGDIHLIETETTTFDFEIALTVDLEDKRYDEYRKKMRRFLGDLVRRKRLQNATIQPEIIIERLKNLHQSCVKRQGLKIKKIVLRATCNCLKLSSKEEVAASNIYDEFDTRIELEVVHGPIFTIGMGFSMDTRFVDIGDVNVLITAPDGRGIETTIFPLTPKMAGDNVEKSNLIIFFHEPLQGSGVYTLAVRSRLRELLFDVVPPIGKDLLVYRNLNFDFVEKLEIIVYLPSEIGRPILENLQKDDERLKGVVWRDGEKMTTSELGAAPVGFQAIGWKASALERGNATGFEAFAPR